MGNGGQTPYEEPQSPMEMKPDPSSLMRGYSPGSPGTLTCYVYNRHWKSPSPFWSFSMFHRCFFKVLPLKL